MNLKIREMNIDQAKEIQALGTKIFLSSFEGFFVSKPKTAKVAEIDGEIVGGFTYAIEKCGGIKLGLVDFFFVKSSHAGQGIGGRLCDEGVSFLWGEGCDYATTFVRDDNVGSWAVFEKQGFERVDLFKFTKTLGSIGFLKTYLKHFFSCCVGCDIYLAARPDCGIDMSKHKKNTGASQIALHVATNAALMLIFIISSGVNLAATFKIPATEIMTILAALLTALGGSVIFAYIGTLFSRGRNWRYRMPNGGMLLCLVLAVLGAFVPMAGNFYPERYENTAKFRRDMGLTAVLPWIYLLGMLVFALFFGSRFYFFGNVFQAIVSVLLLFRCIPFKVINLGSVRVYQWSKPLCLMLFLITFLLVFPVPPWLRLPLHP